MFRQDVVELGHEVFPRKDCGTLFYQIISLFRSAITALKYTMEIRGGRYEVKFIILMEVVRLSLSF